MKEQIYLIIYESGTYNLDGSPRKNLLSMYCTDLILIATYLEKEARVFSFPQMKEIDDISLNLIYCHDK